MLRYAFATVTAKSVTVSSNFVSSANGGKTFRKSKAKVDKTGRRVGEVSFRSAAALCGPFIASTINRKAAETIEKYDVAWKGGWGGVAGKYFGRGG